MNNAWQSWMVLGLVVLAAAYSVWYLLPARFRKPLGAVHQALARSPSCGSCSSCSKCGTPAPGANPADVNMHPITFHRKR